jgi:hypothetical protein
MIIILNSCLEILASTEFEGPNSLVRGFPLKPQENGVDK